MMLVIPEDIKSIVEDIGNKIDENLQKSVFKGTRADIIFAKSLTRADFTTVRVHYALPVGHSLSLRRSFNLLKAYRSVWNELRKESEGMLVAAGFKVLSNIQFDRQCVQQLHPDQSLYDKIEEFIRASIAESKFNGMLEVGIIKTTAELNGTKVPKALLHYWCIGDNIAEVPAFVKEHREEWEAEQKKHLDFVISKGLAAAVLNP